MDKLKIVETDEKYYNRFYYSIKKNKNSVHVLPNISHLITSLSILFHRLNEGNNNRYGWRHQNPIVGYLHITGMEK